MKLVSTNRMIDGLEVQVNNPLTNRALKKGEVIDLEQVPEYIDRYTLLQIYREGDLTEYVEPVKTVEPVAAKTTTKDKE